MKYEIITLSARPEMKNSMAEWFHQKWGIPKKAYLGSMDECLSDAAAVPQWYVATHDSKIIGGLGVIENDFHDRPDLAPNVCAVFVEPEYRGNGIAGALLDFVCADMKARGICTLYLLTDHDSFYERYGWEYLCPARGNGEDRDSRMYVHR